jgi:hypothetical protein
MTCTLTVVPYPATTATARTNIVTNPSFETGLTGLVVGGTGAAALTRMGPYTAGEHPSNTLTQRSAWWPRANWTVAQTVLGGGIAYQQAAGVVAGQTYSASLLFRASKVQRVRLAIQWNNSGGAAISTSFGPEIVHPAAGWQLAMVEGAVAPAGAVGFLLYLYNLAGASASLWGIGDLLEIDNLMLEVSPSLRPYFDGDTLNAPVGSRYGWSGTPHASASTLTARTPLAMLGLVQVSPDDVLAPYVADSVAPVVFHKIIGRPDPVPALAVPGPRAGRLEVWCSSLARADAVRALYALGRVVMFRDTERPSLDMYHVATQVSIEQQTGTKRWVVTVSYTEVYGTAGIW